ncbi:hypothetical protein PF005_g7886 [Phytophthora fragariae]|uniref:RxLR effector protein n=1 Tax=Phytophthora fragariae TaxID=53985 RepID=A0A6A3FBK7_9STRA|nr:hypothetical protein PF003_g26739 [Phytophthora fragariae]KAE8941250.1 hypothetical protein PF009_g8946 [Phytophthora fragariae]KAE9119552.1 hypothetical protein PF010_g7832 [Phytophthora fragariae]KAE9120873.1 hypothetical protein PF007_g8006 [Phytophthora fragariae]KAE9147632.1 hypothetical protein PF006_g7702 [Phytophthora fragariae]
MRLSNTLVVACAAVLLTSGYAKSETANVHQATALKLAPSELGASIDALASENKRSLRRHDDVDDDDDDDEEDRYAYEKIQNLQKGTWTAIFKKWGLKRNSRATIQDKLKKAGFTKKQSDTIVDNYAPL